VASAGERDSLPADAVEIDGTGKHVFPGLIAAYTSLGLQEIGQVRQSVDVREVGDVSPEARAAVAVNPDSAVLPVTRTNGVLIAGVFPSSGLLPGRASVIALEGWTWEDMTIRGDAGVVVDWPSSGGSFRGRRGRGGPDLGGSRRKRVEAAFVQARAWNRARTADADVPTDIRWEALVPVLEGERPVFLLANDVESIETAVGWALREGLRPVIVGGREALLCAELLRRHDVPVILGGTHELPSRRDQPYDERFTLPARLHDAGVRFCIATGGSFYNERNLPYHVATAVAFGLPHEVALQSITSRAAEILGVGDRVGTLESGKDATLIVTDGDPLELVTRVELAFVQGREVDLRNKQTELARKYREKYRQLGLTR
jgi:imidazolonepropionase-like amidohydrolase